MKSILFSILILFFFTSCNPCRNIAKYERCFPADTVKLTEYKTKYVKEVITNDSIVFEQIPCDPKTNTVYDTKTIYKTNWRTTIDTIYTAKVVDRVNPINTDMQAEKDELSQKNNFKNKVIWIESILLLIIALLLYWKIRRKFIV